MEQVMKARVLRLFDTTELTIQGIADEIGVGYKGVSTTIIQGRSKEARSIRKRANYRRSKLGSKNPMSGKTREQHPSYIGEISDGYGYLMVLKPDWYTGRKGSKHVFKHTVVFCEALGLTEMPKGFVLHHIDGGKHNNNLNNLALMTNGAHTRLHYRLKSATTIRKE